MATRSYVTVHLDIKDVRYDSQLDTLQPTLPSIIVSLSGLSDYIAENKLVQLLQTPSH